MATASLHLPPVPPAAIQPATPTSRSRPAPSLVALAAGFALTVVPVLLGLLVSGQPSWREAYLSLMAWDSAWYESIARYGYQPPPEWTAGKPNSLAFFPGYPIAARAVGRASGIPMTFALLVTSQAAAWGFWTLLITLLHRRGLPPWFITSAVLFLWTQPAAFYLVVAYSEALFLITLLAFLTTSVGPASAPHVSAARAGLAGLAGLAMTATRLVGLPLAVYPLLHGWLNRPQDAPDARPHRLRPLATPFAVAAIALLGGGLFFLGNHLRFGQWDAFFKAEHAGWYVEPRYRALLHSRTYFPPARDWREGDFIRPGWLSRLYVSPLLASLAALAAFDLTRAYRRGTGGWRRRLPLYACASLLLFTTLVGRISLDMEGIIRYAVPILLLWLLAAADLAAEYGPPRGRARALLLGALAVWCPLAFLCQLAFLARFTHGVWVA